jgi:hypothetical protein
MELQGCRRQATISVRERLRRRFRDAGADALPDYELPELILFRAVPRRDTKPLDKRNQIIADEVQQKALSITRRSMCARW